MRFINRNLRRFLLLNRWARTHHFPSWLSSGPLRARICERPEAKFLDEIQTKVLRFVLLAIQSHLYSFALRFLFLHKLTQPTFLQCVTVQCKEKGGKPFRKPHPLSYGLRNPYRNLKCGELSRLCPETSKKLFMNSASGQVLRHCTSRLV